MATRIHELDITSAPTASMYLAVDQQQATYASQVKHVIGTVIGTGAPATAGGNSLTQQDNGEIVLNNSLNVPAGSTQEGGQVNLFFSDGKYVTVDAFNDLGGYYKHNGVPLGTNEKYMRLICLTDSTNNGLGGWVSGLLLRVSTGQLYVPVSSHNPSELMPINASSGESSSYDDSALWTEIQNLKTTITNNTGSTRLVEVSETPPTATTGALWWDTNNATMYVYEGTAWVVANPS